MSLLEVLEVLDQVCAIGGFCLVERVDISVILSLSLLVYWATGEVSSVYLSCVIKCPPLLSG